MKMEHYIMIDGKRIDLTEEQIKILGLETEEKEDYFQRVGCNNYYYIKDNGKVIISFDKNHMADITRHEVGNYCTDVELLKQRALHETLNRLLWRFSMQNDGDKIDWSNEKQRKFTIYYNSCTGNLLISRNYTYQHESGAYFYTEEIAQRAIDEIILPFVKEHPEFMW